MHLTFDAEVYAPLRRNSNFLRTQEKTWEMVLDLLDTYEVAVTNFVTWEFAEMFPDLLMRMVSARHEIGSHSLNHQALRDVGQKQFEIQVRESGRRLQRATGQSIFGFRAPYGQVPSNLARILVQCGYLYDSSLAATYIPHRFSGLLTPRRAFNPSLDDIRTEDRGSPLWEIPISVSPGVPVPFGGFFLSFLSPFVQALPGMLREPGVMFLHPYDFVDLTGFPESYPWDRHKFTRGNWRLLEHFGRLMAGEDATLKHLPALANQDNLGQTRSS